MSVVARADVSTIPFAKVEISPEAKAAVLRVLESGWLTTGPEVVAFEFDFAEWLGAEHAIAVSSCSAAIELTLRALDLPPGSKVLASTMTFCGAVNAILHAGHRPVLADVNVNTLMPDAETTAAAVRRVGGVDAMTVVHFAGHPAPVEEMAEAARLPLDRVVEDAAHALGAWVGDRPVGTISAATCFSFYATKNLPIGEGGMVTTGHAGIGERVRRGRLHGMDRDAWRRYAPGSDWRYAVETLGIKANMTDLLAAIGRAQLRHFDAWQARRDQLAARYDAALSTIDGISIPARPLAGRHAWHLYVVQVLESFGMDRDRFIAALAARDIHCSVHFIPLHRMPYLQSPEHHPENFVGAETVFPRIVSLPLYPALSDDDVDRVCTAVADLRSLGSPTRLRRRSRL